MTLGACGTRPPAAHGSRRNHATRKNHASARSPDAYARCGRGARTPFRDPARGTVESALNPTRNAHPLGGFARGTLTRLLTAGRRGPYTSCMTRRYLLLLILVAVLSFKAGAAFDRWLHRPIRVGGFSVSVSDSSSAAPRCFSDKPEACPRAPAQAPEPFKLRPITGPCFFDPLRNEACQQET